MKTIHILQCLDEILVKEIRESFKNKGCLIFVKRFGLWFCGNVESDALEERMFDENCHEIIEKKDSFIIVKSKLR